GGDVRGMTAESRTQNPESRSWPLHPKPGRRTNAWRRARLVDREDGSPSGFWIPDSGFSLFDLYSRLLAAYGPQHWWPAESAFEMIVGAFLVQNTAWSNVEKAIARLKAAGMLSPEAIQRTSEDELAGLIRSSGYFRQKAKKVKAFVAHLF